MENRTQIACVGCLLRLAYAYTAYAMLAYFLNLRKSNRCGASSKNIWIFYANWREFVCPKIGTAQIWIWEADKSNCEELIRNRLKFFPSYLFGCEICTACPFKLEINARGSVQPFGAKDSHTVRFLDLYLTTHYGPRDSCATRAHVDAITAATVCE